MHIVLTYFADILNNNMTDLLRTFLVLSEYCRLACNPRSCLFIPIEHTTPKFNYKIDLLSGYFDWLLVTLLAIFATGFGSQVVKNTFCFTSIPQMTLFFVSWKVWVVQEVRGCEGDVDFSLLAIHHSSLLTGDIIRKSQIKVAKYLTTFIIRILSHSK